MGGTEPKTVMQLVIGVVIVLIAMILTGVLQTGWNIITLVIMMLVGAIVVVGVDFTDGEVERPIVNSLLLGFIYAGGLKIIQVVVDWVFFKMGLTP